MLVYFGVRAIFRGFKCMSYPEVYILGRQVDGVYVEYFGTLKHCCFEEVIKMKKLLNKWNRDGGTWKILKYGRPITVEV
ncbi:hypothetical protein EY653_06255 [Enterococcus faecalis]|nr:hypothetical protein [Enterococcus faecalis]MBO6440348.1 hypothetical protein [Enterococcus faecalis]MBO6453499.1 hypothetical protein [Enterococcus faecalis]